MQYRPIAPHDPINKSVSDIHNDLKDATGDGFDGIAASDGVVSFIVGELSDNDVVAIEDYLGVDIEPSPDYF